MANTIVITKQSNNNILVTNEGAKNSLDPRHRPILVDGGLVVEIKNNNGSLIDSFNPDDVEKVVRKDGVEIPISDVSTLFDELEKIFIDTNELGLQLTAYDELLVGELSPIFQYSFEYTVDNTELNKKVFANGGTITQADAMGIVQSSTTPGSIARLQSKRQARYRSGLGGLARITTIFETAGGADTVQIAGLGDEDGVSQAFKNGYAFGRIGTPFGFHRFVNDTLVTVLQTEWNDPLDGLGPSGMTLLPTKLNVWQIRFRYLGGGPYVLFIEDDSTGKFIEVHRVLYSNQNIQPSVFMPNFNVLIHVDNKATNADLILKTSSFAYFIEGKTDFIQVHQPQHSSGIITKIDVTTEIALFTIQNKATYAGKTNFIEVVLENLTSSIEANAANNLGEIRLVRNATLGGTPVYTDINTTDSVIEIDVSATTVADGKEFLPSQLAGKNDSSDKNLVPLKLILPPGETLTVAGRSDIIAVMKSSLLWRELF